MPSDPHDIFASVGKYTPYRTAATPNRAEQMSALLRQAQAASAATPAAATAQSKPAPHRRRRILYAFTATAVAAALCSIFFLLPTAGPMPQNGDYAELADAYYESLSTDELEMYNDFAETDYFLADEDF